MANSALAAEFDIRPCALALAPPDANFERKMQAAGHQIQMLEQEGMLEGREIRRLQERLSRCSRSRKDLCVEILNDINSQFQKSVTNLHSTLTDLEARLMAKLESAQEDSVLMEYWLKVSDCTKLTLPFGCRDLITEVHQALGETPMPHLRSAPLIPRLKTPAQEIAALDFLPVNTRNQMRQLLIERRNNAFDRLAEADVRFSDEKNTKVDLAIALQSLVGNSPRVGAERNKAYLEQGVIRVHFDPLRRYFTITGPDFDGKRYLQFVKESDGTLRAVRAAERAYASDRDLWVARTHFSY